MTGTHQTGLIDGAQLQNLKLHQVGLLYSSNWTSTFNDCSDWTSTFNELLNNYRMTINSKDVLSTASPLIMFCSKSFLEPYPGFNVFLLCPLSSQPVIKLILSLNQLLFDEVRKDFKLLPQTCHTLVLG